MVKSRAVAENPKVGLRSRLVESSLQYISVDLQTASLREDHALRKVLSVLGQYLFVHVAVPEPGDNSGIGIGQAAHH